MISRRSVLKYGLWGLASGPLGCWSNPEDGEFERPSNFSAPKNCLFIVLDAATAGHLRSFGYRRATTPNIDGLASNGFVFRNAVSQASATVPSVRSYLTGRYPNEVRPHLLPGEFTMAKAFRQGGFETALFSENPYITRAYGYHRGFSFFRSYFTHDTLQERKRHLENVELDSEKMYHDVRAWITAARKSPWFVYVHNLRPHAPYRSPTPFAGHFSEGMPRGRASGSVYTLMNLARSATPLEAEYIAALYDENLRYCDHLIGQLLQWLEKSRRLDDTLVVITSDHGEAFMEHGWLQHGTTVYEEMIRVPLVVRFPESAAIPTGETFTQVELLDLFPTLASTFDLPGVPEFDGRSLLPLLSGSTAAHKERVFTLSPRKGRHSFAVRTADRKYIVNMDESGEEIASRELYDLEQDADEGTNLLPPGGVNEEFESAISERFSGLLGSAESLGAPAEEVPSVDEKIRDALEALGYVD